MGWSSDCKEILAQYCSLTDKIRENDKEMEKVKSHMELEKLHLQQQNISVEKEYLFSLYSLCMIGKLS